MKIINIVHFPIDYNSDRRNFDPIVKWKTKTGKVCAIWDGIQSQIIGNGILKKYPEINYEVWRTDVRADKIFTHTYPNGLAYRLFPSNKISYYCGLKRHKIYFSKLMVKELEKYVDKNEPPVLHINACYRHHDKLILDQFYNRLPILGQFYTKPPTQFESIPTINPLKIIHRNLIKKRIDNFYKKNKYLIPSTQYGLEIFENKYKSHIFYRNSCANGGINFNRWNIDITKEEARRQLNIDNNSFVFFSSSRLVPVKQLDLMIKEFAKIKEKPFLVFQSGNGEKGYIDELKRLVNLYKLDSKIIFIGFVEEKLLKLYYKACDVSLSTSKSEAGPFSTALAAFYELPIITTKTGLVYDYLKKENSALYIDKDNSSEWHLIFSKVIDGFDIPIISKEKIKDFFNWNRIAEYYNECYKYVLNDFYKNKIGD